MEINHNDAYRNTFISISLYLLALFKTDEQFGLAITVPSQCVLMEADS